MKNKKQTLIDLQAIYDHAKHLHDDIQLRKNSPNRLIRDNSHSAIFHYCNYEIAEMSMQPDHLDMIEKHISCANEKINALNEESNAIEESLHQSQMQVETTEAMYLRNL